MVLNKQEVGRFTDMVNAKIDAIENKDLDSQKPDSSDVKEMKRLRKNVDENIENDFKIVYNNFLKKHNLPKEYVGYGREFEDIYNLDEYLDSKYESECIDYEVSKETEKKMNALEKNWKNLTIEIQFVADKQETFDKVKKFFKANGIGAK